MKVRDLELPRTDQHRGNCPIEPSEHLARRLRGTVNIEC